MKTIVRILPLVVFLLPAAVCLAADIDGQIEAVQETYKDTSDISTDFIQNTYIKVLDRTTTKKGKMYFKKGGKFRIEYEGKGEKVYVSDGKFVWVFVPGDETSLTTFKVNDDTVPKEAMSFLSGFGKLKKDFKISASDAFGKLNPGESSFYLKPKSKKAHFVALDAKFNPQNLLNDLKVLNKSGNVSDYHFTNIKTSKGLADSMFSYGSGKATPDTLPTY